MSMRIEIECPYCFKVHVHTIQAQPISKKADELESVKPHDEETEDLENFREEA